MRTEYILIRSDEDGNPVTLLGEDPNGFLANPLEYGIKRFEDSTFLHQEPDANYWPDDVGVLLKVEVIVPRPAGAFRL